MTSEPTVAPQAAPPSNMDSNQKFLTALLWAVLGVAMLLVIGAGVWSKLRHRDPVNNLVIEQQAWEPFAAPTFAMTDQEGRAFGSEQLTGRPYVAAFIFTHCTTGCSMMSAKMSKLQQAVPDKHVKFVSFTVDPERDTPEVLKQYAKNFNADADRWHFLSGTPDQVAAVAAGLKATLKKASDGSDQFDHSTRFYLIDADGQVRGAYLNSEPDAMEKLAADAEKLAKGGTL
jgi:protein SCO1/2